MEGSTHSEIGSSHWFTTLMSHHLHVGEFLKKHAFDKESISPEYLKIWGEMLYDTSKELMDGFAEINKSETNKS